MGSNWKTTIKDYAVLFGVLLLIVLFCGLCSLGDKEKKMTEEEFMEVLAEKSDASSGQYVSLDEIQDHFEEDMEAGYEEGYNDGYKDGYAAGLAAEKEKP